MAEPSQALVNYAQMVEKLHQIWIPHKGQVAAGKALFHDNIRSIFIQCGRKWGKTELIIYFLWRWAQTNPGMGCYYVAPQLKQAREIVWADPRIKNFGPRDWLLDGDKGINNTEMRLKFKNGSFIKVDGSDNFDAHRGTRPGILCYEEYKDHKPEYRSAMRPNLSVYNAPEIFIGTPPEGVDWDTEDNEFVKTAQEHLDEHGKTAYYCKAPVTENPHISTEWLEKEKKRLFRRGDHDEWFREYMADFVKGGKKKIFPMLDRSIIRPHQEVLKMIHRDRRKLQWMAWADPAASSIFGVLFGALNPYSRKIYMLDEIYEKDQMEMTVRRIGRRINKKCNDLWDREHDWRKGYDEAETWFMNEMFHHFGQGWEPTMKHTHSPSVGITLIKDVLLCNKLIMSDRCEKLFWEMNNYNKTDRGELPKKNNHLIDDFRYMLDAWSYDLNEEDFEDPEDREEFRGATIRDDFPELTMDNAEVLYAEWEPDQW